MADRNGNGIDDSLEDGLEEFDQGLTNAARTLQRYNLTPAALVVSTAAGAHRAGDALKSRHDARVAAKHGGPPVEAVASPAMAVAAAGRQHMNTSDQVEFGVGPTGEVTTRHAGANYAGHQQGEIIYQTGASPKSADNVVVMVPGHDRLDSKGTLATLRSLANATGSNTAAVAYTGQTASGQGLADYVKTLQLANPNARVTLIGHDRGAETCAQAVELGAKPAVVSMVGTAKNMPMIRAAASAAEVAGAPVVTSVANNPAKAYSPTSQLLQDLSRQARGDANVPAATSMQSAQLAQQMANAGVAKPQDIGPAVLGQGGEAGRASAKGSSVRIDRGTAYERGVN